MIALSTIPLASFTWSTLSEEKGGGWPWRSWNGTTAPTCILVGFQSRGLFLRLFLLRRVLEWQQSFPSHVCKAGGQHKADWW